MPLGNWSVAGTTSRNVGAAEAYGALERKTRAQREARFLPMIFTFTELDFGEADEAGPLIVYRRDSEPTV